MRGRRPGIRPPPRGHGGLKLVVDPLGFLLTAGILIVVAFLAQLAFRRLHMPDVPVLILFGALLAFYGVVDRTSLLGFAPVVAAVALPLIAMEAGLELRWAERSTVLGRAVALGALCWAATAALCAAVAVVTLGYPWPQAVLFGVALGGAGVVAVLPALQLAGVKSPHIPALTIAAAVTDLLAVLAFHLYGNALVHAPEGALAAAKATFLSIAVATVCGAIAGWLWARALGTTWLRGTEYLLTLGALFVLVAGVTALQSAGALAVVAFAVAVANTRPGARFAAACSQVPHPKAAAPGLAERPEPLDAHAVSVAGIHREVLFIARALVLVDLGAMVDPAVLREPMVLAAAGGVALATLAARAVVFLAGKRLDRWERAASALPFAPGMAAAVLASLPPQVGTSAALGLAGLPTVVAASLVASNLVAAAIAAAVRRPAMRARLTEQPGFRRPVKGKQGIRFGK